MNRRRISTALDRLNELEIARQISLELLLSHLPARVQPARGVPAGCPEERNEHHRHREGLRALMARRAGVRSSTSSSTAVCRRETASIRLLLECFARELVDVAGRDDEDVLAADSS